MSGDMADMALSNWLDIMEMKDLGYEEDLEDYGQRTFMCKYCDKIGLVWKKMNDKWRLFDNDKIHLCSQYIRG